MQLEAPITWNVDDVAAYFGRERHWVTARCRLPIGDPKRIPNVKLGRDYRFSPQQVVEWFEAQSRWNLYMPSDERAS